MSETRLRGLPGVGGALSRGRLIAGFVLTVAGLPLLTWPLVTLRVPTALTAEVLSYQLFVVVVALVGGLWPALLAAVGAGFFLDFFFEPPLYVIRIAEPAHFATLIIFVIVAVLVSIVVDQAARRLRAATRLAAEAATIPPLAAADRLRSALLAAVGHDLRRPLSAATAAVTSLRATDVTLSAADRAELLETADESLSELAKLVTDLLDASRLQAGVLGVTLESVSLREIVGDAITELGLAAGTVTLEFGDVPTVSADPALLQRVVVNVLANAIRFAPGDTPPVVSTELDGATVHLRVIDTGPGVPPERREEMFLPFQRLGDTDNTAGVGLGLALARGFVEAMGGSLSARDTPGGGLTMVVALAPDRGDDPGVDGAAK